jgi:hypothetical protein
LTACIPIMLGCGAIICGQSSSFGLKIWDEKPLLRLM